ncbi:MAG: nuclease [Thiohalocapsa sp.]|uniref:ERCC4 domain-containing protein n=1 Tax=Thiohalocapsa sp. TaxID=2497641 RepID=UPI0025E9D2B1|nr:ERCC4 domain-containing protein [Thiohalocapsa sp.]MCG6940861.1 nuclease [Thiohalocapsa sp.]
MPEPTTEVAASTPGTAPRPRVRIVVDDREPAAAVSAALQRHPHVELRVERLPIGDYRVDELLLFERKTLPDLAQSIKDGRLFGQALRLLNEPLQAAIILEGRGRDLAASHMRREAIQGALAMLTVQMGLPLLRAADADETAALILLAARQRRAWASGAPPRHGRRPRGKERLQSHILQGLPGIGASRARHLIERFGSVEAVITASAEKLTTVAGIGKATAAAIRWAVEEPPAEYRSARLRRGLAAPVTSS